MCKPLQSVRLHFSVLCCDECDSCNNRMGHTTSLVHALVLTVLHADGLHVSLLDVCVLVLTISWATQHLWTFLVCMPRQADRLHVVLLVVPAPHKLMGCVCGVGLFSPSVCSCVLVSTI